jgi:hypothetical protein
MTTFETLTYQQVVSLRSEALAAGDTLQASICDRAIPTPNDDPRIFNMTTNEARVECARVIANAEAQEAD